MIMLSPSTVLGAGAVYNVIGLWRGRTMRPGPPAVAARFQAAGFTVYMLGCETLGGESSDVYGLISTAKDGVTVQTVLRVMGLMGATGGGVWASEATLSDLSLLAMGGSVGELGTAITSNVQAAADAATDITDIASVIVRNWPIALAVVVVGYLLFTGKLRI